MNLPNFRQPPSLATILRDWSTWSVAGINLAGRCKIVRILNENNSNELYFQFKIRPCQFLLQLIRRLSCDSLLSRQLIPLQIHCQPRCSETDLPVSFSNRTNGRKILVFGLWLATLPEKTGATWNLKVTYCLTFSEKRTVPPFGLWSAHPSPKLDWKGSLPCLSISLVLSSSERLRNDNFSTQPRLSLSRS